MSVDDWEDVLEDADERPEDLDGDCAMFEDVHFGLGDDGPSVIELGVESQSVSNNKPARRVQRRTREDAEELVLWHRSMYLAYCAWALRCNELASSNVLVRAVLQLVPPEVSSSAAGEAALDALENIARWFAFRFAVQRSAPGVPQGCDGLQRLLRIVELPRLQLPCNDAQAAVLLLTLVRALGYTARLAVAFNLPKLVQPLRCVPSPKHSRSDSSASTTVALRRGRKRRREPPESSAEGEVDIVDEASSGGSSKGHERGDVVGWQRQWVEVLVRVPAGQDSNDARMAGISVAAEPLGSVREAQWIAIEPGASGVCRSPASLLLRAPLQPLQRAAGPLPGSAQHLPSGTPTAVSAAPHRTQRPRAPPHCVLVLGESGAGAPLPLISDASFRYCGGDYQRRAVVLASQRALGLLGDAALTTEDPSAAVMRRSTQRMPLDAAAADADYSIPCASDAEASPLVSAALIPSTSKKRKRISAKAAAALLVASAEKSMLGIGAAMLMPAVVGTGFAATGRVHDGLGNGTGLTWADYSLRRVNAYAARRRQTVLLRRISKTIDPLKLAALQSALDSGASTLYHGSQSAAALMARSSSSVCGVAARQVIVISDDDDDDHRASPTLPATVAPAQQMDHALRHDEPRHPSKPLQSELQSVQSPSQPFPTNAALFKTHPLYALERFLGKDVL
jgi:hypothetical protein